MQLDHLMWACPDLVAGIAQIQELTGVTAEYAGSHEGLGTCNALLSLGQDSYLEIIAPDPQQSLQDNFGGRLAQLDHGGLLAYAMTVKDLTAWRHELSAAGFKPGAVRRAQRTTAEGQALEWALLFVRFPGAPFYIDWLECQHPATTSPGGAELTRLNVAVPNPEFYRTLLGTENLSPLLNLREASTFSLQAELTTPNGGVTLPPLDADISLL